MCSTQVYKGSEAWTSYTGAQTFKHLASALALKNFGQHMVECALKELRHGFFGVFWS